MPPANVFLITCTRCSRIKQYNRWLFIDQLQLSDDGKRQVKNYNRKYEYCPKCEEIMKYPLNGAVCDENIVSSD